MKRILIVGGVYDKHAYRFISHLKKEYQDLKIDIFSDEKKKERPECIEFCELMFSPQQRMHQLYKIKILGQLLKAIDFRFSLQKLAAQNIIYDAILILWVSPQNMLCANIYRQLSKNIILVPLGSDVLRISKLARLSLRPFYQKGRYIVLHPGRFKQETQKIFNINESQIIALDFGSSQIDSLLNSNISKIEAQRALGITNKFIITIGYNAVKEQNHLAILKQITMVREQLPQNLFLILPMTYPISFELKNYIQSIKDYLQQHNYDFRIFNEYLNDDKLLYLRKCSDVFIHAQTTDASCATVQEYLLSDCTILNGEWLHYPELEEYGIPYYTFKSLNHIGPCLIEAIDNPDKYRPTLQLKEKIAQKGWNYQIKLWISFLNSLQCQI